MMNKQLDVIHVQAYSVKHAERVAAALAGVSLCRIQSAEKSKGSLRVGKTCKSDDRPVKGARKWETRYEVFTYGNRIAMGRDRWEYTSPETVRDNIETKTEATAVAKEMAVKHQMPMAVKIVQALVSHDPACADFTPNSNICTYTVMFERPDTQ